MPFTKVEIITGLLEEKKNNKYLREEDIVSDRYFGALVEYLTGAGPLDFDQVEWPYGIAYHATMWHGIFHLLKDVTEPSDNDERVLNVIKKDPVIKWVDNEFYVWLLGYIADHPDEKSFVAAMKQWKSTGKSDEEIFKFIVNQIFKEEDNDLKLNNKFLRYFLKREIKSYKKLFVPKDHYTLDLKNYAYQKLYFELLDEAGEEYAFNYIVHLFQPSEGTSYRLGTYYIFYYNREIVSYWLAIKDGLYIPKIINELNNEKYNSLKLFNPIYYTGVFIYYTNKEKYLDLTLTLSRKYLNYYFEKDKDSYEVDIDVNEESKTPASTFAIHLLLTHDKDETLKSLSIWKSGKKYFEVETLAVLFEFIGEASLSYFECTLLAEDNRGAKFYEPILEFLRLHFAPAKYLPLAWLVAKCRYAETKTLVGDFVIANDQDAEKSFISQLGNKSGEIRVTAAMALSKLPSPTAKQALFDAINKEQNETARDILIQSVIDLLPAEPDENYIAGMVAAAGKRGKLNKPIPSWIVEKALTPLYYKSGKALTETEVRFLLYRMSCVKGMRSDLEAKYIINLLDIEKATPFALQLLKLYADNGGKTDEKYILALVALMGSDTVVDKITAAISKWIEENRNKMAEYGVGALAIQGSDKALRRVEILSRKYMSKKANIGVAALAALENAAEELGISIQELGDRIVPDFGFDGLFRTFTAGGEEFRAFIDSNFKIACFNEANKKLKSIPSATDKELQAEFKAIAKEVKDVVKAQSSRLEYYLIIQRKWTPEQWQKFFLNNPVMFIYATRLLWGVYKGDELVDTFMCNEDTSLQNGEGDEIGLPDGMIGIVHPTDISEEQLNAWKKSFFDSSIAEVFPQLQRPVPDMKDISMNATEITIYEGRQMKPGSIRGTLEKYGWGKGSTGDYAEIESFKLKYPEKKLEALLDVSGVYSSYGYGSGEEKLGKLQVIDRAKKDSSFSESKVMMKDVPKIFLYEIIAAINAIAPAEKSDKEDE